MGFTAAALTSIVTSPAAGGGTSASTSDRFSGPPNPVATIAVAMSASYPGATGVIPLGAPIQPSGSSRCPKMSYPSGSVVLAQANRIVEASMSNSQTGTTGLGATELAAQWQQA